MCETVLDRFSDGRLPVDNFRAALAQSYFELGDRRTGNRLFHAWLKDSGLVDNNVYIVCGDRHWQYHAQHPDGIEEFSTGALVDNNSRAGRLAGDPKSTDPDALIQQFYIQGTPEEASGGFLHVSVSRDSGKPTATFSFYDDNGVLLYEELKTP